MDYKPFDVVIVPFPFTDKKAGKRRPALVLSDKGFHSKCKNCVLTMITSAKNPDWPLDATILNLKKTGLPAPSKVRMKIFSLDERLIVKKIGALATKDQTTVTESIKKLMPWW